MHCGQLRKTGYTDRRSDRPNMFFPILRSETGEKQVLPIGLQYESVGDLSKELLKS